MRPLSAAAGYLWRFFIGDSLQVLGLLVAFGLVALLHRPLGAWDGLLAFLLVAAVVSVDAWRRARPAAPTGR